MSETVLILAVGTAVLAILDRPTRRFWDGYKEMG
jgi:hypothetical protein